MGYRSLESQSQCHIKRKHTKTGETTIHIDLLDTVDQTQLDGRLRRSDNYFVAMSGRLVILPKKTYCPWNPENVERVLRDERRERERQEDKAKAQHQQESQKRWDSLKKNQGNDDDDAPERFSLFEEEEKQQWKDKPKSNPGVMPVFLGASLAQEQTRKAAKEQEIQGEAFQKKEARRKSEMDPMKEFSKECKTRSFNPPTENQFTDKPQSIEQSKNDTHRSKEKTAHSRSEDAESSSDSDSSCSRRRHKRRKKRRKHKRSRQYSDSDSSGEEKRQRRRKHKRKHSSIKKSDKGIDFAELRRRRLEREEKEKQREKAAIQEATGGVRSRGSYQNQYHPRLSRN